MLKIHVVKTDLNIIALAESFALFTLRRRRRRREIGPSLVALLQPANNFLPPSSYNGKRLRRSSLGVVIDSLLVFLWSGIIPSFRRAGVERVRRLFKLSRFLVGFCGCKSRKDHVTPQTRLGAGLMSCSGKIICKRLCVSRLFVWGGSSEQTVKFAGFDLLLAVWFGSGTLPFNSFNYD